MPTPFFMRGNVDIEKSTVAGGLFALQRGGTRLVFFRVRLSWNNITRLYNYSRDGLMRGKGAAAVNVLALVIAFFSRFAEVTARAGMGHATAEWTMHHKTPLQCIK
ncbi:hypothetical protein JOE25_002332 [Serratia sp. PL17]|nr:hypothetical protein [Serratia sp. PL17]